MKPIKTLLLAALLLSVSQGLRVREQVRDDDMDHVEVEVPEEESKEGEERR